MFTDIVIIIVALSLSLLLLLLLVPLQGSRSQAELQVQAPLERLQGARPIYCQYVQTMMLPLYKCITTHT